MPRRAQGSVIKAFRLRSLWFSKGPAGASAVDIGRAKRGQQGRCMLKVLIAEDDLMIADTAEEILVECGYEVCGIARTVAEGIALGLRHKPDLALIDLRLGDGGLGTAIGTP